MLFFIGAVASTLAFSTAVPFLQAGTEAGTFGFIDDISPNSTNGTLALANARSIDRPAFFCQLLGYGALVTVVASVVLWLLFVMLPG